MGTPVPLRCDRRLFLALWPDAPVRQQIARHARGWTFPGHCQPYAPADWHVTLHFLGGVPARRVAGIDAHAAVPFEPFELLLDRPLLWPRGLAVVTPSEFPPRLADLHRRLGDVLRGLDLEVETRPYQPHLTLARHASQALAPPNPAPVNWHVAGYALVVSTGDSKPRYQVIGSYP